MRTPKKHSPAPAAKRSRRSAPPAAKRARSVARRPDADGAFAEALEQQEATADILRTISHSPSDAQPVFDAIAQHASRLCSAEEGTVFRFDGELIHVAALADTSAPMAQAVRRAYPRPAGRYSVTTRAVLTRSVVQVDDVLEDLEFDMKAAARESGIRSALSVPMMRGEQVVGAITVARHRLEGFSARQIALLETFAEQAVIAIDNARLFNETKEALEHQRASAEILKVVSSSVSDSQPVFDGIVAICARLFPGYPVGINVVSDSGEVQLRACAGIDREALVKVFREVGTRYPGGGLLLRGKGVQFPDVEAPNVPVPIREACRATGARAIAYAPLVADGRGIGSLWIGRTTPAPFSGSEIALLQTFAEQAVVAIRNARLFNETKEALEEQTASAEILRLIGRTTSDLQPILDSVVTMAARLCNAQHAFFLRVDSDGLRPQAWFNVNPDYIAFRQADPIPLDQGHINGRVVLSRTPVHVHDVLADSTYPSRSVQPLGAYRTVLAVPVMRDREVVGTIAIFRTHVQPFTDTQVRVMTTFADQVAIAIENVRLFNETREALERQTATAEILRVISGSPTDVQPVFDAIVSSAVQLCDAVHSAAITLEDGLLRIAALKNWTGKGLALAQRLFPMPVERNHLTAIAVRERRVIHSVNLQQDPDAPASSRELAVLTGYDALLIVPMVREGHAHGAIVVARKGSFSKNQITLLQTFADQAVIAIENVRLFKALEERNQDLAEALRQQTSTAEVLKTISRSTFDLNTVLQTLLDNATRLSGADRALMYRPDAAGNFVPAVTFNYAPDSPILARLRARPIRPGRDSTAGRALLERRPIHIADVLADPEYGRQDLAESGSFRAVLAVPMLRDGEAIGLITFTKGAEAGTFTDKQMDVVTTFADQAVIAIENMRLFNETKDALEQQKASAEVLGAISSSIADSKPVFDKILKSCEKLFAGKQVGINLVGDDGQIWIGAYQGPGRAELERLAPFPPGEGSGSGAAIAQQRVMHYPDAQNGPEVPLTTRRGCIAVGVKSIIFAPMLWKGRGVGAIFVGREFGGAFSDKEIALLRTFSDQAAIGIENARMFRELEDKTRQLEVANKHKSDFLANMSHELRTPLNAIIGFSEVLIERMFGEVNEKQHEYLNDIHESGRHLLSLINDILDLSKIEAGRMELDLAQVDVPAALANALALVRERAQRHGLELALTVDPLVGPFRVDERKFKQILLNLLSNAVKFTPDGGRVELAARLDGGKLEVAVCDTGIGIAAEDQQAVFDEFRQVGRDYTKKAEGTGLGLALVKRLVTLHGGEVRLVSAPGRGSTFAFTLPERL